MGGAQHGTVEKIEDHKAAAADLTASCHQAYDRTQTKIGPETFEFTANDEVILSYGEQQRIQNTENGHGKHLMQLKEVVKLREVTVEFMMLINFHQATMILNNLSFWLKHSSISILSLVMMI